MSYIPSVTGWIETFEILPNGDVLLWVHVASEGITEPIRVTRQELAGIAEAVFQ